MRIDRAKVESVFLEYVSHYNVEQPMIRLKLEHTNRVSRLCERIAGSLELSAEDADLAWLIGMLHDIGRFEQQKQYGTFIDAESIDHARYGADILFEEGLIRDFVPDAGEDDLIRTAVCHHSAYRLPERLDERILQFCNIIRDADKIDILRANVEFPMEEIYNVTTQELYDSQVTDAVMESFGEEHAVLRSLKRTAVDHVVGHISLAFELVYPVSRSIMKEQGYLDKLLHFPSRNPKTEKQFESIRRKMEAFL